MGSSPFGSNAPRPLDGSFVHHSLISCLGSPVPLLEFQMAPRIYLLISSVSTKKKSKHSCLSDAKASHSQKTWIEVSTSASHLTHKGLQLSPIKYRCLLRVLYLVRKPVTALDYILIKNSYPSGSLVKEASLQVSLAQPP